MSRAPRPPRDEPRNHPRFLLLLAIVCLATVPVFFVGPSPVLWLGLPVWLWWSLGWTAALSALTAWGVLRYWKDDDGG